MKLLDRPGFYLIVIGLIGIIGILTFSYLLIYYISTPTIKHNYYIEINKDSLYYMNKEGDTIYIERYNDANPTPLQQAINKDNL